MKDMDTIRAAYDAAGDKVRSVVDKIDGLEDQADEEIVRGLHDELEVATTEHEAAKAELDRAESLERARSLAPQVTPEPVVGRIEVGKEEEVYRKDGARSFYGDLVRAQVMGDRDALERVHRHEEMQRDVTAAGGGAGVIPPGYLPELFAPKETSGRPFISQLQRAPLPADGTSFDVPVVATAPSVALQATENNALSETDPDINVQTYYLATYGGIVDFSLQSAERSDPSFDAIVQGDLMEQYWTATELGAFTGAGTARTYLGLDNVSSILTETWTEATPTQLEAKSVINSGLSQIASAHYKSADLILMHPRRAHWFADATSTESPLFQLGSFNEKVIGGMDTGRIGSLSGVPVVASPSIATDVGAGTDQDSIYVLRSAGMYFMEGPMRVEVFRSPGSATGTIRMRLYAYSAIVLGRYPNAICKIDGTGLVTPEFYA